MQHTLIAADNIIKYNLMNRCKRAGVTVSPLIVTAALVVASLLATLVRATKAPSLVPLAFDSNQAVAAAAAIMNKKTNTNTNRPSYDRALIEEQATVPALAISGCHLHWFRLDDGVMGGQSETRHQATNTGTCIANADANSNSAHADGTTVGATITPALLLFQGTINTNGGGFCTVKTKIPSSVNLKPSHAIKIRYRGDGKTYKVVLSSGRQGSSSGGGGISKPPIPSWQADLPTDQSVADAGSWQEAVIPFSSLLPSYRGGSSYVQQQQKQQQQPTFNLDTDCRELGFMLSLKLSNGSPNPKETYGEGIFDFSLHIKSLELVEV